MKGRIDACVRYAESKAEEWFLLMRCRRGRREAEVGTVEAEMEGLMSSGAEG